MFDDSQSAVLEVYLQEDVLLTTAMRHTIPSLESFEAHAFRRQQTAFCFLTLFVLGLLLLVHTVFASVLGEPSIAVVAILGIAFSLKAVEIVWLQGQDEGITEKTAWWESVVSITGIFILAGLLAVLTNRDDSPYFVLLAIPILQCAYYFGWKPTLLAISTSVAMMFFWTQHFFAMHPPARASEFLQIGMISIIYVLIGILVWLLVHQLKQQQIALYNNMTELESTRQKLNIEEKLAAVGRLAGGIAHEIRNPVAMISSSLATAANPDVDAADRAEMVQIAAREAGRLGLLTTEFLTYARPRTPQRCRVLTGDLLTYVADVVKSHAAIKLIEVICTCPENLAIDADPAQVQGALLNLVLNGIDAAPPSGSVRLNARRKEAFIEIDVQNTGDSISGSDISRIFEPFYSTKPSGTGLGLAIARRVAQTHGGDLWVSCNQQDCVTFSMTLPALAEKESRED